MRMTCVEAEDEGAHSRAARVGFYLLPPVLRLICLSRGMGDQMLAHNDKLIVVGADIPRMSIVTRYVTFSNVEQRRHDIRYFNSCDKLLRVNLKDEDAGTAQDGAGRMDWAVLRLLSLVAFSSRLGQFVQHITSSDTVSDIYKKKLT
ncbi:hypothetical protein FE257_011189 [Aspergillus nanangensis]|uniref:Uncharacterized protein n=1 Tax=Aspergillus nanangensis TaxID=2582783 RepID=A0AAD4GRL5_ASPNN|nr:hypothetical protein FE257_011189 [Aspergillus nanangensis]